MKYQTINLVKFKRLARMLELPVYATVGILETIWIFALNHALDGDLSKYDSDDIASWIGYEGDPDHLIEALVGSGWLDVDLERGGSGLSVHDWCEHMPTWAKGVLSRRPREPRLSPGLSRQLSPQLSPQLSRELSPQLSPALSAPLSAQLPIPIPTPKPKKDPPNPPRGKTAQEAVDGQDREAGMPRKGSILRQERTGRRKGLSTPQTHDNGCYAYPGEFDEVWDFWQNYETPKGSKQLAYQVWRQLPETDWPLFSQAAQNYCRLCHASKTKTKHVVTWAKTWRDHIVPEEVVDPEEQQRRQRALEMQSLRQQYVDTSRMFKKV